MKPLLIAIVAGLIGLPLSAQTQTPAPQRPTFTAGSTIVPVDVRVVDNHGDPITNLKQSDFVVLENGVPQSIKVFSAHALTPEASALRSPARTLSSGEPESLNRRVFLIVLGRGRLENVSHGIQAAEDFVHADLLPQDAVAVMAWDRATNFSTDHTQALGLLDRLRTGDDAMEAAMNDWFSGLRGRYGSKEIPPAIQTRIDNLFASAGVQSTAVPGVASPNQARMDADRENATNAYQSLQSTQTTPVGVNSVALPPVTSSLFAGVPVGDVPMTLDGYVAQETRADQDLSKLYAGIEYLRAVEGEKHLVFITQTGLFLPRVEDDKDVAARASDARVVLDTIQTGGGPTVPLFEPSDQELIAPVSGFGAASMERLADLTGGISSIYSHGSKGFDALNRETMFEYLIGYTPSDTSNDGSFREIDVKVDRPGVTLAYRRGYFSFPVAALNEQQVTTYTRVLGAAGSSQQDFKMKASVGDVTTPERAIDVKITLDGSHFTYATAKGRHTTSLDIAVFSSAQTTWQTVNVDIADADFARMKNQDMTFTVSQAVDRPPNRVVVVVYDYAGDVVSSYVARDR